MSQLELVGTEVKLTHLVTHTKGKPWDSGNGEPMDNRVLKISFAEYRVYPSGHREHTDRSWRYEIPLDQFRDLIIRQGDQWRQE